MSPILVGAEVTVLCTYCGRALIITTRGDGAVLLLLGYCGECQQVHVLQELGL